jgi:hypothetical protein
MAAQNDATVLAGEQDPTPQDDGWSDRDDSPHSAESLLARFIHCLLVGLSGMHV